MKQGEWYIELFRPFENMSESSLTSRPAKIRVENKSHIEVDLVFVG